MIETTDTTIRFFGEEVRLIPTSSLLARKKPGRPRGSAPLWDALLYLLLDAPDEFTVGDLRDAIYRERSVQPPAAYNLLRRAARELKARGVELRRIGTGKDTRYTLHRFNGARA